MGPDPRRREAGPWDHKTIRYMEERFRHADRWHGAIRDWPKPITLAWGMLDPVATPGGPRRRAGAAIQRAGRGTASRTLGTTRRSRIRVTSWERC